MFEPHEGTVKLEHTFDQAYQQLHAKGEIVSATAAGTHFTARAGEVGLGSRAGKRVIRFYQVGPEYGRAYECCWGHYYNCNRTRIGMYCKALDSIMD